MDDLRVLIVGDCRSHEFREAVGQLTGTADVVFADDLRFAIAMIDIRGAAPDLVILAQRLPRQFNVKEVDQLRRKIPTTRFVAMLGSWCEGEERSGEPLPGVQRIYWHRWKAWWSVQQQLLAAGRCPDWGQAVTLAEEDRQIVADAQDSPLSHLRGSRRMVAVAATHWEMSDWLCEACRHWGHAAVGVDPREHLPNVSIAAVVWDCRDPDDFVEVTRLRRHFGDVPVLALANFPRWQHRETLIASGVASLLAKPFRLNELREALERLIPISKTKRPRRTISRVA